MKKVITLLAALAVSLSFAQAADADKKGDKKGTPEERFKKLDSNSDGSISMDEMKASPMAQRNPDKVDERFKKMDKDSDGKLSMEEFSAMGGKKEAKGEAKTTGKPAEPAKPGSVTDKPTTEPSGTPAK